MARAPGWALLKNDSDPHLPVFCRAVPLTRQTSVMKTLQISRLTSVHVRVDVDSIELGITMAADGCASVNAWMTAEQARRVAGMLAEAAVKAEEEEAEF
jgi:hypothetical protein